MDHQAKLYIGTSGWSYPKGEGAWKGYFYPTTGKINELEYYSQFFKTVEINSTFYRPPNPGYVYNWVRRVPDDFLFTVKLWQKFTHPKMYKESTGEEAVISQEDVDTFNRSLEPLMKYGKLGALLAQFPPSFKNDSFGRQIISAVIKTFNQYRLAVELRHRSWSDDEDTSTLLRSYNVAWVKIDEPKFSSSIATELPITSDMAYFRFHGRNKNWFNAPVSERYDYFYSAEELRSFISEIRKAQAKAGKTYVFFNNCHRGSALKNAQQLKEMLVQ